MPTHMTIDINGLLTEIRRLSKTNQNWKIAALAGLGAAVYMYYGNKKLKSQIEEMTTKGE